LFINYHLIIVLLKQSPSATGFIFQHDGVPVHTARNARNRLRANCPDFITTDQWPPKSLNKTQWTIVCRVQCWRLTASLKQSQKQSPSQGSASGYLGQPAKGTRLWKTYQTKRPKAYEWVSTSTYIRWNK